MDFQKFLLLSMASLSSYQKILITITLAYLKSNAVLYISVFMAVFNICILYCDYYLSKLQGTSKMESSLIDLLQLFRLVFLVQDVLVLLVLVLLRVCDLAAWALFLRFALVQAS